MNLVFKINGTDITPYIKFQGIKYTRNDVDGPNAGRGLDGRMIRDRVATKAKWNIECVPLTENDMRTLYNLLMPETFTVTTNMVNGTNRNYTCYSNNWAMSFLLGRDPKDLYEGISFPIVEC